MAKKTVDTVSDGKKYKVKKLGFANGVRNFHTGEKLIKLVEGEYIDESDYDLFSPEAKKIFFE